MKFQVVRDKKGRFAKGSNGFKGKHHSEITKQKIRDTLKRKKIMPPISYGRTPWNKGIKGKYHYQKNRGISKGYINTRGYFVYYRYGKEILAHREIWEKKHKRPIPKGDVIHHKDENRLNNEIGNLILLTKQQHSKLHHPNGPKTKE